MAGTGGRAGRAGCLDGDVGSTRRGRAGTVPPAVALLASPVAGRAGAENTGVTGAGGRFGAVCGRGAAEKLAAGTGPPVAGRLGGAGVGALLKATGAGRPAGTGEA
ncbi:MAG: hypothetical protein ACRDSE_03455 [Pseudonocardiaceae bacterium]